MTSSDDQSFANNNWRSKLDRLFICPKFYLAGIGTLLEVARVSWSPISRPFFIKQSQSEEWIDTSKIGGYSKHY